MLTLFLILTKHCHELCNAHSFFSPADGIFFTASGRMGLGDLNKLLAMRLQLADVFAKTAEDARVRTTSGGVVSLIAFALLFLLLVNQVRSYFTFTWDHKLVIDGSRGGEMTVFIDMTFMDLPCDLLNVDSIDENGDFQLDIDDHLTKTDLDAEGRVLDPGVREAQQEEVRRAIARRPEDYEGPCYGAEDGLRKARGLAATDPVRCFTCADIHAAYAALNWAFDDGSGFEQCREEGYPAHVVENRENGCRVRGLVAMPKVAGQLHFAPGESHFISERHSHDLSSYNLASNPYSFRHKINELRFGGPDMSMEEPTPSDLRGAALEPLKGYEAVTSAKQMQFRYYVKVVGTSYDFADGRHFETNQYSVTHHERPLHGGRDSDHPNSIHKSGGIPGIWLSYDISPMKVVETEVREQNMAMAVMNVLAIAGAVITSAAMIDKGVYAVDQALKQRKTQ